VATGEYGWGEEVRTAHDHGGQKCKVKISLL